MSEPASVGRVYVVLVNWRTAAHTVECIESVLRSDYPDFQVVVCDNASGDGSVPHIQGWASGSVPFVPPPASPVPLAPPVPKPVPCVTLSRAEAERGGDAACAAARVVVMETGANLGFAGGCNVGMRYAMARGDAAYVWLLNNDTVVDRGAMRRLVERLVERPDAGKCGSTIYFYDEPGRVQALGGTAFEARTGRAYPLPWSELPRGEGELRAVEAATDYVEGASMMVTRRFLEDVGLLSEAYFLYYEELDWARRAAGRFRLAYAPASIVYHKEGASAGSSRDPARRSATSDWYLARSRLRFTWRMNRRHLPTTLLGTLELITEYAQRGEVRRALMLVRVLLSPRTYLGYGR